MTSAGIFGVLTEIRNAQVTKAVRLPSGSSVNQKIARMCLLQRL